MNFVLRPWQQLLLILAGWINRDQQDAIEYLLTENQVLREKLGKGRILLNDDQRRRLAVKGKVLGRKSLGKLAKIVRPDTLLRWHRELIARKWDHSDKRQSVGRASSPNTGGRPGTLPISQWQTRSSRSSRGGLDQPLPKRRTPEMTLL